MRQSLFVALFRAFAESLAAENAARLAAMQSAETVLRDRVEQLCLQFHRERQDRATAELLDVVTGSEIQRRQTARPSPGGLPGAARRKGGEIQGNPCIAG